MPARPSVTLLALAAAPTATGAGPGEVSQHETVRTTADDVAGLGGTVASQQFAAAGPVRTGCSQPSLSGMMWASRTLLILLDSWSEAVAADRR